MKNGNGYHGKVEIVDVSPTLALRFLTFNASNRNLRSTYVEALARDMRENRWHFNGDPIRFSKDGRLIDGQHRLNAVVLSGKTITFLVVRELDFTVQETIDIGAIRTAADTLKLRGLKNPNLTAAIARKVILWDEGKRWHFSNYKPTNPQIVSIVEGDSRLLEATDLAQRYGNTIPVAGSVTGFTWYVLSKLNRSEADRFFEQLATGIGTFEQGAPVITLRNRLVSLRNGPGRIKDEYVYAAIFRAWNADRGGHKLAKIIVDTENFPEPVA